MSTHLRSVLNISPLSRNPYQPKIHAAFNGDAIQEELENRNAIRIKSSKTLKCTVPDLPWSAAEQQVAILQGMGIAPSAFVWVHAQNETDFDNFQKAADLGVWISWDGIGWEIDSYVDRILFVKERGFLDPVLISHDAGWYKPGEPDGGDFQPFTGIFTDLVPDLDAKGFTKVDWKMLLIDNPKRAFALETK